MNADGKAPGGNPEPKGQGPEKGTIRLIKSCDVDGGSRAPRLHIRPDQQRPEREALTRAEVAVCAMRDARRTGDTDERRQWLLLAQSELLKSLKRLNGDLERFSA